MNETIQTNKAIGTGKAEGTKMTEDAIYEKLEALRAEIVALADEYLQEMARGDGRSILTIEKEFGERYNVLETEVNSLLELLNHANKR